MKSKHKIVSGLTKLLNDDKHLLQIDSSERSITHRLGIYYQDLFPNWDVDCEYNRYFDKPKDVEFDIRYLLQRMADLLREKQTRIAQDLMGNLIREDVTNEELINLERQLNDPQLEYAPEQDLYFFLLRLMSGETIKKSIIPDIIIHKRNRRNNYIAIEAKKTSHPNVASREYDILKLQAMIRDERYNYKQGYFIDLPVSETYESFSEFICTVDSYEPRVTLVLPRS